MASRNHFSVKRPYTKPALPSKDDLLAFIGKHAREGRHARDRARLRSEERRPRRRSSGCCASLPTKAASNAAARSCISPGRLPHVVVADITERDRDGELIAVPIEWDEEEHGAPPKIRIRIPRRARPDEVGGVGDRALLRIEAAGEDGDAHPASGPHHQADRSRRSSASSAFSAPAGRRRPARVPVDKKQLGRELAIPPGAEPGGRRTAISSRSKSPRGSGFGLPTRARQGEARLAARPSGPSSLIAIHAHGIPHVFPAAVLARGGSRQAGERWRRPRGLARAAARHHRSGRRQGPRRRGARRAATPIRGTAAASCSRVAIADVAHYVRPGTALDREALDPRQFGLFPGPRRADAAGAHLQRPVLAAARRGPRRARGAHGDRRRRPQAHATLSTAC